MIKHINPNISLSKITGAKTPTTGIRTGASFTPIFTTTSNVPSGKGITSTISYYIVTGTNNTVISNLFNNSGDTVADLSADKAVWTQKTVRVKCVTTVEVSGQITTTKTGYSNQFTVYLSSPTIAYRKNRLGINTVSLDNGTVLDVYIPSDSIKYINLHNTSGGKIQIDLIESTIDIV